MNIFYNFITVLLKWLLEQFALLLLQFLNVFVGFFEELKENFPLHSDFWFPPFLRLNFLRQDRSLVDLLTCVIQADEAIKKLKQSILPFSTVKRDGKFQEVFGREVRPPPASTWLS